jgi:hypothetical protein
MCILSPTAIFHFPKGTHFTFSPSGKEKRKRNA